MTDSPFTSPPPPEKPAQARRRTLLGVACVALLASAIIMLLLPIRLPLPVRLTAAGTDVIAALVVFVAWRQAARPRP